MIEIIFCVLFLIPAMLGMAEIIHMIKSKIISKKGGSISYIVVVLKNESPLSELLYQIEKYKWYGENYAQGIIAINSNLDEDNMLICAQMAERYGVHFCSYEEMNKIIMNM